MTQNAERLSRVEEIRKALGFDQIEPIILPLGMRRELEEEGDVFRDWYEEELVRLYENRL